MFWLNTLEGAAKAATVDLFKIKHPQRNKEPPFNQWKVRRAALAFYM